MTFSGIANFVRATFSGKSKEVAELIAEIQRVMFTHTNVPKFVTEDKAGFFHLLLAFHNYESTVSGDGGGSYFCLCA